MKKVACLYRVSTKQQVTDEDIPMQRNACIEFIERHSGWCLYKEYREKGVSGFKKKAADREVLEQLKAEALDKQFQILLVFMFDRLGRIEEETPFILKWFVEHGIEMWSVKEGQRTLDSHADNLLNYITFWQAAGESKKNQLRTLEAKQLMREENRYLGCAAPYGYRHISIGRHNVRGREIRQLVIHEEEAAIVKQIFDMYTISGYGARRITNQLNEDRIMTKKGRMWAPATVTGILKNSIYTGRFMYGRYQNRVYCNQSRCQIANKKYEDLVIISDRQWEEAQSIFAARAAIGTAKFPRQTKSALLFVGNIYCGICGERMGLHYSYSHNQRKDGTVNKNRKPYYVCAGKQKGRTKCISKGYTAERIEGAVLRIIYGQLEYFKNDDIRRILAEKQKKQMKELEYQVKGYRSGILICKRDLQILKNEIIHVLKGESAFSKDLLYEQITQKEKECAALGLKLEKGEAELIKRQQEAEECMETKAPIPTWKDLFAAVDTAQKKVMLSDIIERIEVNENEITLLLNMELDTP